MLRWFSHLKCHLQLLKGKDYTRIKRNPTATIEKKVKDTLIRLERNSSLPTPLRKRLTPQQSKCPQIYGLPKVHKAGIPLRPIVSTIGSPTYQLAKELCRILSPIVGKTNSYIRNSSHFVERISEIELQEVDRLVSFDVKSLFTMVPIDDSLRIIRDRLVVDDTLDERTTLTIDEICDLTNLCLRSTFFRFNDCFYEQKDGTAMGSPLSPVVANIFMEDFEGTALVTCDLPPKLWLRYVDDTFVVWQHGENHLGEFLEHLNGLHTRIDFTMEEEVSGKLPFLDVLVERKDNRLTTDIYRKPTNTNRYLNYRSSHHPRVKMGIIKTLRSRAEKICGDDRMESDERKKLKNIFMDNGYPRQKVQAALRKKTGTCPKQDHGEKGTNEEIKTLVLPYTPGLSENIDVVCKHLPVKIAFTSKSTLGNMLTQVKTPIPPFEKTGVIYAIHCECGGTYIGETGRTFKIRMSEHKRAIKIGDHNNAISVHVHSTGHSILWDKCEVLAVEENWRRRKIREAILIKSTSDTINTDPGVHINPSWDSILPSQT